MNIKIYQIISEESNGRAFLAYRENSSAPRPEDYTLVFEGNIPVKEKYDILRSLEEIYYIFNYAGTMPENFHGRSLSVSDIVETAGQTFYVDDFGFVQISDFDTSKAKRRKIKVFVKEPGKAPEERYIENELSVMQNIVGGYIEPVTVTENFIILCDEEGLLKGYDYNCKIVGVNFSGPIIFIGSDGEEFDDFPANDKTLRRLLPSLFI